MIAFPVTRDGDQPRTVPFKLVVPLPQLLNHTLSKKLAEKVVERVPFFVGEYQSGDLPPTLKIAGRWVQRAFKIDTYYSFVVVAFTKVSNLQFSDISSGTCVSFSRAPISFSTPSVNPQILQFLSVYDTHTLQCTLYID